MIKSVRSKWRQITHMILPTARVPMAGSRSQVLRTYLARAAILLMIIAGNIILGALVVGVSTDHPCAPCQSRLSISDRD